MPRKKVTASVTGSGSQAGSMKMASSILGFFRTADLAVALFAAELVNETIKERQNKGKAVIAGRAKVSDSPAAVDAATKSAVGANGPEAVPAARKKPGPPKGTGKGKRKGAASDAPATTTAGDSTSGAGQTGEVTGDALPPQETPAEGSLDLG